MLGRSQLMDLALLALPTGCFSPMARPVWRGVLSHGHHMRCARGGTLTDGPVVLSRRQGLAGEHRGGEGIRPGKVMRMGTHRRVRAACGGGDSPTWLLSTTESDE
jgi:hypothetical protein